MSLFAITIQHLDVPASIMMKYYEIKAYEMNKQKKNCLCFLSMYKIPKNWKKNSSGSGNYNKFIEYEIIIQIKLLSYISAIRNWNLKLKA